MNNLLQELAGGDLRSDGKANMVAEQVMKDPHLLGMLVEGLSELDDVIRARTAHALERISCYNPEMLQGLTSQFINRALTDTVPMVKWHLAMLFQNILLEEQETDAVVSTLFHLLEDKSVFVRSWSIVSLCVIGAKTATKRTKIMSRIRELQEDESIAVRTKVTKALHMLEKNGPLPAGWSRKKVIWV